MPWRAGQGKGRVPHLHRRIGRDAAPRVASVPGDARGLRGVRRSSGGSGDACAVSRRHPADGDGAPDAGVRGLASGSRHSVRTGECGRVTGKLASLGRTLRLRWPLPGGSTGLGQAGE